MKKLRAEVEAVAEEWERLKVLAACNGLRTSTADQELQRIELGCVYLWDKE